MYVRRCISTGKLIPHYVISARSAKFKSRLPARLDRFWRLVLVRGVFSFTYLRLGIENAASKMKPECPFNASLSSGEVPRGFKLAHVTPLFKAGDPSVPTNYRPVSLLPVISKLLEKLVQKALVDFVDPALPNTQFAFRPGHSTEDVLALLSDTVLQARDNGSVVATCLLDMSKAFDKVKHATFVQDLFSIGISGTALKWLRDYLSGRHQRVRMGSRLGRTVPCICGVPQGSVLGPMLFSIIIHQRCPL